MMPHCSACLERRDHTEAERKECLRQLSAIAIERAQEAFRKEIGCYPWEVKPVGAHGG